MLLSGTTITNPILYLSYVEIRQTLFMYQRVDHITFMIDCEWRDFMFLWGDFLSFTPLRSVELHSIFMDGTPACCFYCMKINVCTLCVTCLFVCFLPMSRVKLMTASRTNTPHSLSLQSSVINLNSILLTLHVLTWTHIITASWGRSHHCLLFPTYQGTGMRLLQMMRSDFGRQWLEII